MTGPMQTQLSQRRLAAAARSHTRAANRWNLALIAALVLASGLTGGLLALAAFPPP